MGHQLRKLKKHLGMASQGVTKTPGNVSFSVC